MYLVAAANGHVHVLQRLRELECPWDSAPTCRGAASKGHVHVLQCAKQQDAVLIEDTMLQAAALQCRVGTLMTKAMCYVQDYLVESCSFVNVCAIGMQNLLILVTNLGKALHNPVMLVTNLDTILCSSSRLLHGCTTHCNCKTSTKHIKTSNMGSAYHDADKWCIYMWKLMSTCCSRFAGMYSKTALQ
jgi:hypothetical protein